jgi:type IV pilus assembly protein PilM
MAKSTSRVATVNLGMQTVTMAVFEVAAGGGLTLSNYAQGDLIPDPSADATRAGQLRVVLGELREKTGWNGSTIACAIPSQGVFARFVKIPKVDIDQVAQVLSFEAQQNVPYPIEEVAWSYQVLPEKDPDKLSALILATKLESLEESVDAILEAKLQPDLIETSPTALYNAFRFNYAEVTGCTLLIDIGARTTNLIFIEGDEIFIRTLPIGGNSITGALHKRFESRPFNEVEELKRTEAMIPPSGNYSGAKTEEIAEMGKIARTVMTRIHNEITRSITFYRTSQKGSAPARVFLAGGGASLPYSIEFFKEKLSLPVEYFNPLRRVGVGSGVEVSVLPKMAHQLGECVGLGINVLLDQCPLEIALKSPRLEQIKAGKKRRPFLVAASALLVGSLVVTGLYYQKATNLVSQVNQSVQAEIDPLQKISGQIASLTKERDQILKDGADLAAAPLLRSGWSAILNELNLLQPEKFLWVTRLSPYPAVPGFGTGGKSPITSSDTDKSGTANNQEPAVTALSIEGLYLENPEGPGVVDKFVAALSKSALFDTSGDSIVKLRATQSGTAWAYEFQILLPLKQPIPL